MTWPMVALILGVGVAFLGLKANAMLSGSRDARRCRHGSSPAAGDEGPIPFARPRSRRPSRHFPEWSDEIARLFLANGSVRWK